MMTSTSRSKLGRRLAGLGSWLALCVVGCDSELGDCNQPAAQELVYGRSGLVATKGQALMHDSCGNAAFCHSRGASGDARYGAPHGLDFDMLPSPGGWDAVREHEADVWSVVEDGEMPPRGVGQKTQGDGDWVFDAERGPGARRLPKLASEEGKAALRNWLACGAPVVEQTKVPDWALPTSDAGAVSLVDWREIHTTVIAPSCAIGGCHDQSAAGKLVLLDACDAYDSLRAAGSCGPVRLAPGDTSSLLLDKLESSTPSCGPLRMPPPPLAPLPDEIIAALRQWVMSGAPAAECD
jgi:hypothetical protein